MPPSTPLDKADSLLQLAKENAEDLSNESLDFESVEQAAKDGRGSRRSSVKQNLEAASLKLSAALGTVRRLSFQPQKEPGSDTSVTKSVRWYPTISVYHYPGHTPDEKRTIWWDDEEFKDIHTVNQFIGRASIDKKTMRWMEEHYRPSGYEEDDEEDFDRLCDCSCLHPPRVSDDYELPDVDVADDKWWRRYGHSRRGVENVGTQEGFERLWHIGETQRAVVEAYRQQVALGAVDPIKLALFYRRLSIWARDLALAHGKSDADAVRTNFDNRTRKSREFYLSAGILKISKSRDKNPLRYFPSFMLPPDKQPQLPDNGEAPEGAAAPVSAGKTATEAVPPSPELESLKDEPDASSSLKKKAASMGAGGASMGAVLSGMGTKCH